jgi:3-dehydroquinate dehydratase-2
MVSIKKGIKKLTQKQSESQMKILVLHGPNLNLIGVRSAQIGERVTLDKVNRELRRKARELETTLKILQTHDAAKAITFLLRNRNKADGLLFAPGPWARCGHDILDTLKLTGTPFAEIFFTKDFDPDGYQEGSIFAESAVSTHNGHPPEVYPQALAALCETIHGESSAD